MGKPGVAMEIATKCCDIGGPTHSITITGRASGSRSNGIRGDATMNGTRSGWALKSSTVTFRAM